MLQTLTHAKWAFREDGTLYSSTYQDIYHSAQGVLEQAQHVFLNGNQLPNRWQNQTSHTILETGFGLGCNFLSTWAAWQNDPQKSNKLHYIAFEQHPFLQNELKTALTSLNDYQKIAPYAQLLIEQWPLPLSGIYQLEFCNAQITLTLIFGNANDFLSKISARVQSFYLDGFSPKKNPDLWSLSLFKQLVKHADEHAHCATYTTAHSVQQGLVEVGFLLEKKPGFGLKKEMLTGIFSPKWKARKTTPPQPHRFKTKKVLIIGAGIAGCTAAYHFSRQNWQTHLYEKHAVLAPEGSAQPAGIVHPNLSVDHNLLSQFSFASFFYALNQWKKLEKQGFEFERSQQGLLQLFSHSKLQPLIDSLPKSFALNVNANQTQDYCDIKLNQNGVYFPEAGSLNPQKLCLALTQSHPDKLILHFEHLIDRIEYIDHEWVIFNSNHQVVNHAPILILANALDAKRLIRSSSLKIYPKKGQMSILGQSPFTLTCPTLGKGYCIPLNDGQLIFGATFEDQENTDISRKSHLVNLDHLQAMFTTPFSIATESLSGNVGFRCTSHDHLPIIGQIADEKMILKHPDQYQKYQLSHLPRLPGLFATFAHGSKGFTWSHLAAEIICAQIEGRCIPIEKNILLALDPARFIFKDLSTSN